MKHFVLFVFPHLFLLKHVVFKFLILGQPPGRFSVEVIPPTHVVFSPLRVLGHLKIDVTSSFESLERFMSFLTLLFGNMSANAEFTMSNFVSFNLSFPMEVNSKTRLFRLLISSLISTQQSDDLSLKHDFIARKIPGKTLFTNVLVTLSKISLSPFLLFSISIVWLLTQIKLYFKFVFRFVRHIGDSI